MLAALTLLLLCQLAGEVIAQLSGLPLPGPVIGMLLLFFGLVIRGEVPDALDQAARGLLDHLSLLFVPAGVGVVLHLARVGDEWLPLSAALVLSTLLAIVVTGRIMQRLGRPAADGPKP
ncbi:MAG: CidA/LrgA family protein [Gammaproteobacteria bacterium]|nr:CidA/LrgA family protein [Gammaproteobacteria bacterium]